MRQCAHGGVWLALHAWAVLRENPRWTAENAACAEPPVADRCARVVADGLRVGELDG